MATIKTAVNIAGLVNGFRSGLCVFGIWLGLIRVGNFDSFGSQPRINVGCLIFRFIIAELLQFHLTVFPNYPKIIAALGGQQERHFG